MVAGKTERLAVMAFLIAATTVATVLIKVDVPSYRIYFNGGEAVVYVSALLLGRSYGSMAGAIGGALADIIVGYPFWAPFTFVIKGLEGYTVASLAHSRGGYPLGRDILAVAVGAAIMIAGYAIGAWLFYGPPAVIVEIGIDIAQTGIGGVIAIPVARSLRKALPDWLKPCSTA